MKDFLLKSKENLCGEFGGFSDKSYINEEVWDMKWATWSM